ncbi:MAG TPA: twin-arginine translocation signal domain-containing protein [Herpetosiphonaceae bacterium]
MSQTSRRQFLQTVALGTGALTFGIPLGPELTKARLARPSWAALAPGVGELIENTYLSHAADFPDPTETVEMLRAYLAANDLRWQGNEAGGLAAFGDAVKRYPNSRHIQAGLGHALLHQYHHSGTESDLKRVLQHTVRAAEIGMKHNQVHYTDILAMGLGKTKQTKRFEQLFNRAFEIGDQPHVIHLDYARGLAEAGDRRAEEQFQIAMRNQPYGHIDAMVTFGEWLLDQGRHSDVLAVVTAPNSIFYPHFLRGVALERQGKTDQARAEYELYKVYSQDFPAPAKYRIDGSTAQDGIRFEDSIHAESHCTGHTYLSIMIYCESRGESIGAQRLVGWTARNRALRGTLPNYCGPTINRSGTICDWYYSVITQPNQFYIACNSRSTTSDNVAYDVFYGYAPEGITGGCAGGGTRYGDACNTGQCSIQNTNSYFPRGTYWFDLGCTASTSCKANAGTLCGNDDIGYDMCFYYYPG